MLPQRPGLGSAVSPPAVLHTPSTACAPCPHVTIKELEQSSSAQHLPHRQVLAAALPPAGGAQPLLGTLPSLLVDKSQATPTYMAFYSRLPCNLFCYWPSVLAISSVQACFFEQLRSHEAGKHLCEAYSITGSMPSFLLAETFEVHEGSM